MRPCSVRVVKALILLSIMLMAGCSVVRLGYQYGETLSFWWLHSYVDFDAAQRPWARQRIDALFAWQRKSQLRDYALVLSDAQKRLQHGVTQAELLHDYDELKKRSALLFDQALPDLADLALKLRPQQILHIEKKYAANSESFRKDYLSGDTEQRQRFRFKKAMQMAEYWFGDFSREQEAQIRKASDARPLNNALLLADKIQRQKELITLLRKIQAEKPAHEVVLAQLQDYVNASYFDRSALPQEQKAFFDASRDGALALAVLIINLASPEQKAHAVKRAQQWIDDFNQLAAAPS